MRKEDLRLAAGMTTNMIANMSKEGKHISMDTLAPVSYTHLAINDGVDSAQGDNDFAPLRNIFNEWLEIGRAHV